MERTTNEVDLRVVGPSDGPETLEVLVTDVPDVVVVSVRPGSIHPLQLCREVADRAPITRVLVLAAPDEAAHSYQALRVGVRGCLDPDTDPAELHEAAEAAARGEALLPSRHAAWVLKELDEGVPEAQPGRPPTPDHLTAVERSVLRLLAEGSTPGAVAEHLGVSTRVIGRHVGSALARLHRRYRRPSAAISPQ